MKDITISAPARPVCSRVLRGDARRVAPPDRHLDQVGGQLTALYPRNTSSTLRLSKILAKDLVKGMAEQGLAMEAPVPSVRR